MKWHLTEKELPLDNSVVLIYIPNRPWFSSARGDVHYKVAIFRRGISLSEREAMADCDRKHQIYGCDEYGNNEKPFDFEEFGVDRYFGQEVKAWTYIDYYEEDEK